jgi:hypothetical protein
MNLRNFCRCLYRHRPSPPSPNMGLSRLSPMFCMLFLAFPRLARPRLTPVLPIHPQPPPRSPITLYRLALLMGRIEKESTAVCDKVDSRSFRFTDVCCSYSYAMIIIIISLSRYMNSSCNSIRNENYEVTNGSGNCNRCRVHIGQAIMFRCARVSWEVVQPCPHPEPLEHLQ